MPRRRSLWPREHGAYAQLAAPLVAALASRAPTLAAWLLAIGAISVFLANEPLLVVLGHRGERMRAADGSRARTRLLWLGSAAAISGVSGIVLGGSRVVEIAACTAVPALVLLGLAYRRVQHSITGEIVAAVALPGLAAPIAVASGLPISHAVSVWAAWSLGYVAGVIAVHRVIARHRGSAAVVDRILAGALAAITLAVALVANATSSLAPALPLLMLSTAIALDPPKATRLRAIGVGLVAMSCISVAVAIATA
jgi:YwiC-like protein